MITALALAVLFVVPGSAFAACAWVLWKHTWKGHTWWTAWWPSQGDRWPQLGAIATLDRCEKEAAPISTGTTPI
jgi:hypothetical protein